MGIFRRICDDIGRHNAADKVIGHASRNRWPVGDDAMLVSTGRLSSCDIVMKTIRAGIPLPFRSAPTSGAVQIAEAHGVTLVGFARASGATCTPTRTGPPVMNGQRLLAVDRCWPEASAGAWAAASCVCRGTRAPC